ncbi:MAG: Flp family type IVb pilin [Dehalococcoidia bacterium]|nr:Flp family type IVb pilin [Dehalococcoidia bacterium]
MRATWQKAKRLVTHRGDDEPGQGLAEYALILAFVALVCAAALGALGGTIASSDAWTIP